MTFSMKPLSCDPARIKGMSERLIISHYENNYGGAVKRLNVIEEKLAELDYANAPGFLINGLKREQLIAMNSMVLHELFFDGLGEQSEPGGVLLTVLVAAQQQTGQSMGLGPLPYTRRRHADYRARYVRAFLSHRLWREGGHVCRHFHGGDPL